MTDLNRRTLIGAGGLAAAAAQAPAGLAAPRPAGPPRPALIRGADILTMDPKLGELQGTDLLVKDGKIAAIGKGLKVDGAEAIDAREMILMPGMCDGHRHLWLTCDAGSVVKTDQKRYGSYQYWKYRTMVSLTPEDHYLAAYIGGLQALDSGVTTVMDFPHVHFNTELAVAGAQGAKDSGIGGWCAFQLGMNGDWKPGDTIVGKEMFARHMAPAEERHWATANVLQDKVFSDSGAPLQLALSPSLFNYFDMGPVAAEFQRARSMGVRMVASHVIKPDKPAPRGQYGSRGSGVYDLHNAGLLGPDFHIAHGNALDDEELKMLRDTGGMLCSTVLGEFSYVAYGRGASVHGRARAAGVPAGIGMDIPNAITYDYFEHIRGALLNLYLEPEGQKIALELDSTELLDFATGEGARALRLGDVTGTITVGKRADLVLLRTDRIGFAMQGSLADRVASFASLQDVDSVWVMGVPRKRGGRMIGVNWADLKARLAKAQGRFRAQAATVNIV